MVAKFAVGFAAVDVGMVDSFLGLLGDWRTNPESDGFIVMPS
jgi:hypothetical protein